MTLPDYLLITLLAVILTGSGTLLKAVRCAVDGYEDEAGFNFGPTPALLFLNPAPALPAAAYAPDDSARANPPAEVKPEGRRIVGSKPPMLPAELQAEDLKSEPGKSSQASASPEAP